MVNYVLSFCKITGASRIFSRNFYLPLLKPLTPKEALRTFRITGKWLLGSKIQHYIPVLLNHRKKRSKRTKNYGKKIHKDNPDFTYMAPILDSENDTHKLLLAILETKEANGSYVYTVEDKRYNIVLQSQLESAIRDGDVIDVLVSQQNDKIIVKLKNFKKIPLEIQYYDESEGPKLYCGEGATSEEEEKFHHHGKYTMSLAKIFEDKEMMEEKWEEELRRIMRKKRRQRKEGSKEWKEMMKETMRNFDWKKFEEDAKKVIEEIEEPAHEDDIEMEIDNLESTKNVNETLAKNNELLDQLPTMKEIPDIIKNMGSATLTEIETAVSTDEEQEETAKKRRVSGVKVKLASGKECFISGQMVHTEDGDVFVPGQTIENEFGLEYAPGITINVDNKPTLINGLIMGEEDKEAMFLPTQSTITADGQLTFASAPEERPKPDPERPKKKPREPLIEIPEDQEETADYVCEIIVIPSEEPSDSEDVSSVELNNSEMEELDIEAIKLKQRLELEKLKAILLDDGLDDVIANLEDKKKQLKQKLEELRKLSVCTENSLVSYVNEQDTLEITSKICTDPNIINRLSDIFLTLTRRAATFRDKNSINADNINSTISSNNSSSPLHQLLQQQEGSEPEFRFNQSSCKLKVLLKSAIVAANDVFKTRPKDQLLALNAIGDILLDVLKDDSKLLNELLELTKTPIARNDLCNILFKQLTQNLADNKVTLLQKLTLTNLSAYDADEVLQKVFGKSDEVKAEAFTKLAKVDGKILEFLAENLQRAQNQIKSEPEALKVLNDAIRASSKSLAKHNLGKLLETDFKDEALGFAQALGLDAILEELTSCSNWTRSGRQAQDFLERAVLIHHLSEKDYSLKNAVQRLKRDPERARSDPRIRQLIRETGSLIYQPTSLRNSRDIPLNLVRTQNLLALEDFLLQRDNVDYPVLISRKEFQAIIPKEAARGVLAGRVAYSLIDESGVTNFKPMHMFTAINNLNANREKRIGDYLNVGGSGGDGQSAMKSNVRNYDDLMMVKNNNCRQVA